MSRRPRSPMKVDISGLDPHLFDLCRENLQSIVGSKKGISFSRNENFFANLQGELASIPREDLILYNIIVSIAIDFERAYGRNVSLKIAEHPSNRFFELFVRKKKDAGLKEKVAFFVNGTKVYSGVPDSFSVLDEAVEKAFDKPE